MVKQGIRSLSTEELCAWVKDSGQPAYRAKQLLGWVYGGAASFEEMTNLPADFRAQLESSFLLDEAVTVSRMESQNDGTMKFLFELPDKQRVEGVLMRYKHGNSVCISTQAGCKMGCAFCASPPAGYARNLTAGEMMAQVILAGRAAGGRVDGVVLMGIGEPLDNFDNTMLFLETLSSPEGYGLSLRHVSLSTCGLVDKIDLLAERMLQLTLSVSLHAASDELRSKLMPVNTRWNLGELMAACKRYFARTGRRISFEYALMEGVNDSPKAAEELAALLKGMNCHVNLIPCNPVPGTDFRKTRRQRTEAFAAELSRKGLNVTIRRTLGEDLNASCGQLRREDQPQ